MAINFCVVSQPSKRFQICANGTVVAIILSCVGIHACQFQKTDVSCNILCLLVVVSCPKTVDSISLLRDILSGLAINNFNTHKFRCFIFDLANYICHIL